MKLRSSLGLGFAMVVIAGLVIAPCAAGNVLAPIAKDDVSPQRDSAMDLHDQMRMICEDQIHWTRILALGIFDDLKGQDSYRDRLLENSESFEKTLVPYYHDGAVEFGVLMEDHIAITESVFEALKAGNSSFDTVLRYWYRNAKEIATLMSALNPNYWPAEKAALVWQMYLDATLMGAIAHQESDWRGDVAAADALHLHTLAMADFMSEGIVQQFSSPK